MAKNSEEQRVEEEWQAAEAASRPSRTCVDGALDAAWGMRVTNARYRKDTDITEFTASSDLKKLCEVELLVPHGERKMRTYAASPVAFGNAEIGSYGSG